MNRKTFAIAGAAAALAAAGAYLGRPLGGPSHPAETCGDGAPARAVRSFGPGHMKMSAALSSASVLRGADGSVYASFELEAAEAAATERTAMNVALVIDHSGSMQGEPLARAKAAARGLVERLGQGDYAALIQYDNVAEVLVPAIPADVEGKQRLLEAIDSIWDRGGTNIGAGLSAGRDELAKNVGPGRVNRMILLSDGNANEGLRTIPEFQRLASAAAERGVRISAVGLGDSYNEDLMQAIAENGRGRYYYARDAAGLEAVFAGELKAMAATVATHAELRLVPQCGAEIVDVFGYEFRREGTTAIVPLADLSGGERRKLVARLRVPAAAEGRTGVVTATFSHAGAKGSEKSETTIALGVDVTADEAQVAANADKGVLAQVAQVESSVTLRQAADAYARGDREKARRLVVDQQARIIEVGKKYKIASEALAPADKPLASFEESVKAEPAAASPAPEVVKGAKAEAYQMAK